MKIRGETALRAQLDPGGEIPCVEFDSKTVAHDGERVVYEASIGAKQIGTVLLSRKVSELGRNTLSIEALLVVPSCEILKLRSGIELSVLALSSAENRVLVSDPYGLNRAETEMWYRFEGLEVATILEPFTPRPELFHGQQIYDGHAIAPPVGHFTTEW